MNAHYSEGDGHYFPVRTLRESENPLLANEEKWTEDGGSDEENIGEMHVTSSTTCFMHLNGVCYSLI